MKCEYTDGCTCTSYDVDGTEFLDLSNERKFAIIIKLLNYTNNINVFERIYSYCLEDDDNIYNLTSEELDNFYKQIDESVKLFKKQKTKKQKEFCIGYVSDYFLKNGDDYLYYYIFEKILEYDGKYTDLGWCGCCGDHIRKYTLNI